ncbi:flavin reductase family protein [Advenella kashmirensis]
MHTTLHNLDHKQRYKLLTSSVVPRPIALVTTIDDQGNGNAAPFSYFNLMGATPPVVALGINSRRTGGPKDTLHNIQSNGEFVVNLVNEDMASRMNECATDFAPGEDELQLVGLTRTESVEVRPSLIVEAPVSLECRRIHSLDVGSGRHIIIGSILHFHIKDEFFDPERSYVLAEKMRLIARMHGRSWYSTTNDLFEIDRPKNYI